MAATGYVGGDPSKVSVAGDTMTGALVLAGDPVADLEAATKRFVEAAVATGLAPAEPPAVTGSRGGNAALASLLDALATLGLITNSTSA